ncbi:MAG TPA: glycosyltransferase [Candidatus Binatia bacterium]|nr:glycosyltransferase [Candidatus Binatia bacterium]
MRIAIVRPFFTLTKGGAERYAVELARALIASGHALHVFAYQWDEPLEPGAVYHRIRMVRKPSWLRVLTFHWSLRRFLTFSDYDIVLGMTPFAPQMVYWLGDGLYRIWTRLSWPLRPLRWLMCLRRTVMLANLWLERKAMQGGSCHFIANSNLVKRQAVGQYRVPEEQISVIYPGVDPQRFHARIREEWRSFTRHALGIGEEECVILFASNNFARKGLKIVFKSLRRLLREGHEVRLVVLGSGRVQLYKMLARLLGIHGRVIFAGATGAIERYYAAADIFVLPTYYDPFAAVCLEAMACGLPVVTTRMNGAAELIEQGQSGLVLDQGAGEEELTGSIRRLLDPRERALMGAHATERSNEFTVQRHVGEMVSTLERVAADHREHEKIEALRLAPDLVINRSYLSLLETNGLNSYDTLAKSETASVVYNWDKRIFLLKLQDSDKSVTLYSKRHRSRLTLLDWYRWLVGKKIMTGGMKEWENILRFHARGLPVVTPVAAGERIFSGGIKGSFVVTYGLDEFMPLDNYLKAAFPIPLEQARLKEKRTLIRAVARLTRRMHWEQFNHRDYYLCHLFVRREGEGEPELRIIDLQRVGHRKFPLRRWLIKDLAELHYSSLAVPLTDWDRLRFYAIYSWKEENRIVRRKRVGRLLKWSQAIAAHDARHQRRRSAQRGTTEVPVS